MGWGPSMGRDRRAAVGRKHAPLDVARRALFFRGPEPRADVEGAAARPHHHAEEALKRRARRHLR